MIVYIYTYIIEIVGSVCIQTYPIRSQIWLDLYRSWRHNPQCFPSLFQHLSLSLKKIIHISSVHSLNLLLGDAMLRKDPRHASRPKSPRRFSAKMSFTRLLQWIKTWRWWTPGDHSALIVCEISMNIWHYEKPSAIRFDLNTISNIYPSLPSIYQPYT